jgi:hypothetical protein
MFYCIDPPVQQQMAVYQWSYHKSKGLVAGCLPIALPCSKITKILSSICEQQIYEINYLD